MKNDRRTRLVEWGKTALIVALSLSGIYLLGLAQFASGSLDRLHDLLFSTPASHSTPTPVQPASAMAYPVRLAVYQNGQRYGLQYDRNTTDAVYSQLLTLLSEALSSAGTPQSVTQQDWNTALCRTGIYVDYLYPIPLHSLSGWLNSGLGNSALTGSARRICLAEDDAGGVSLFYINASDGSYYASRTTLSLTSHLETAVRDTSPNGALFAFEVPGMESLDPYTLLTTTPQARIYHADNPLLTDSKRVSELLTVLGFRSQSIALDPVSGGQYVEGNDFFRLSPNGMVSFHTVGNSDARLHIPNLSLSGTLDYVRALANQTAGAWCGEARLNLSQVQETPEGLEVTFQYCLNGSAVTLKQADAARFLVKNGTIIDFSLYLRTYTDTQETTPLLPVGQATAAMEALDANGRELTLVYQDSGAETVMACWAAE